MKLHNIFLAIGCAAILTACSDDFLENKPQGSLSDAVMTPDSEVATCKFGLCRTFGIY